ncbi:hypothetical protein B4119_3631 [Parageobacillus caldoxylosilyticus]|uniref:Uncharacterized protein n=1 Tax=Saccharococcus caldoxylosilyticus TaxID=81408 RepID=A0A150LXD2_9BACL|nr:hypothetical protein B4119_3631 [Parageobacillus caldoxylosilyticus]
MKILYKMHELSYITITYLKDLTSIHSKHFFNISIRLCKVKD